MAWYNTGTLTIANGAFIGYGSGTAWVDVGTLNPGDILWGPDGKPYEIATFNANGQFTLASHNPYLGSSASGAAYNIIPIGLLPSALAQQVKSVLTTANTALASAVLSTAAQGLTSTQQGNARANIAALGAADVGAGALSKSVAGNTDVTLSATEAANLFHTYTGTLTGNINVIIPAAARSFFIYNNTSGAYTLTVKTASGTGIAVPQGGRVLLECDGTNVVNPLAVLPGNTTVNGALTVANGITSTAAANSFGASSFSGVLTNTSASGTWLDSKSATTGFLQIRQENGTGGIYVGLEGSVAGTIITGSAAYDGALYVKQGSLNFSADNGSHKHMALSSTALTFDSTVTSINASAGNAALNLGTGAFTAGTASLGDPTTSGNLIVLDALDTNVAVSQTRAIRMAVKSGSNYYGGGLVGGLNGSGTQYAALQSWNGTSATDIVKWDGTGASVVGVFGATGIYSTTTASAANTFVDTDGTLKRSTSMAALKTGIEDMEPSVALALVEKFRAVWYRSLCPGDNSDWSWYGAIAEEVAAIDPRFVHFGYLDSGYEMVTVDDGEVDEQVIDVESQDRPTIEMRDGVPVRIIKQVDVQVPRVVDVQVIDADGSLVFTGGEEIDDPVTETVTEHQATIEMRDGVPVQVVKPVEIVRPVVNMVQVVDEAGNLVFTAQTTKGDDGEEITTQVPVMAAIQVTRRVTTPKVPVMHQVPVMRKVSKSHQERRLKVDAKPVPVGIQYERFTVPLMVVSKLMREEIASLRAEFAQMKAEIMELNNRIAALEAKGA